MFSRLPALLIISMALLLGGSGVTLAVAGIARYQADAFLLDWEGKGSEPEPSAWAVAVTAAQRAATWYPVANGDYLDRLGRIYSWQYFQQPFGETTEALGVASPAQVVAIEESRRKALAAYRAAVAVRPRWPGSWARYAHAKLYLQEIDAEFFSSYERAGALGVLRPEINLELAEIGFRSWPVLTADLRELALTQAAQGVKNGRESARLVQELAVQGGLSPLLCARVGANHAVRMSACR